MPESLHPNITAFRFLNISWHNFGGEGGDDFFFIFISIPFIIFALLSLSLHSRNSDPGSQSRLFSPLPTTVRAFIFIARRVQHFLPSSTRVEFCLPTLLSALGNNWCLSRKKPCVLAPAGVWTHNSNLSSIRGYTLNHRGCVRIIWYWTNPDLTADVF